jgi:periplasmic copper chaperone A
MMRHDDVGSKMQKAVFSIAFAVLLGSPASAHITLEGKQAAVGSYYKAVFAVPHGCAGSATIKIRVQIPEGVIGVKPMPKTGWNLETVKGKYAGEYQFHGSRLSEGIKEVAWGGGKLADDNFDEFVISTFLTDTLKPNTTLYFPVVQECEQGISRWIDIPAEGRAGQDHGSTTPAPGLKLMPKP